MYVLVEVSYNTCYETGKDFEVRENIFCSRDFEIFCSQIWVEYPKLTSIEYQELVRDFTCDDLFNKCSELVTLEIDIVKEV